MGCGSSNDKDPYSKVLSKYGGEKMRQLAVSYARVHFIESSKNDIMNIIHKKLQTHKQMLMSKIYNQKEEIQKKYTKSISKIERLQPNAIERAKKAYKTNIQDIMGYNDISKKLSQFREESRLNLQRQQNLVLQQLARILEQIEENQRKEVPQLCKFDNMDDEEKNAAIKTAKQKYSNSVQKALQELENILEEKCNYQNFSSQMQRYVTNEHLKEIDEQAETVFLAGEQRIKGASQCQTC